MHDRTTKACSCRLLSAVLIIYVENAPGRVPLEEFCVKASIAFPELSFTVCSGQNCCKYLVGTQKMLRLCPPAGMVSTARIINDSGEYTFQVLMRTIEMGNISSVNDFLSVCEKISKSGNYKFCPGMNVEVFNEIP